MMTTPLWCLVGFAAWAIVLVSGIAVVRVGRVLAGKQSANSFSSGQQHGGDRYWRMNRAHMNCVENLPIFAAIVVALSAAKVEGAWVNGAAIAVLVGRVAQSTIHIASNANMAVNLRFTAYLTQLVCFAILIGAIATH